MKRMVLAVTTLAVFAVCGCTRQASEPTVASASRGGAPRATETTDVLTNYVDRVRTYVKCLRAGGVDVTDPDPKGDFQFGGDLGKLKLDPKFVAAQEHCRDLLPPRPAGLDDKPVKTAAEIETARAYARCMRVSGAPDFPDPGPDGYYPDRRSDGSTVWDQNSDGARRAERACASVIGDPTDTGSGVG